MSLGKEILAHAPKSSWWVRTGRAFLIAAAAQKTRMHQVPKIGLVILDEGHGRISRPNPRHQAKTEVCE